MSESTQSTKPKRDHETLRSYWYPDRNAHLNEVQSGYEIRERLSRLALSAAIPLVVAVAVAMLRGSLGVVVDSFVVRLRAQDE
jgi:hypothetical protein